MFDNEIDIEHYARELKVSTQTIRRGIKDKTIPAVMRNGKWYVQRSKGEPQKNVMPSIENLKSIKTATEIKKLTADVKWREQQLQEQRSLIRAEACQELKGKLLKHLALLQQAWRDAELTERQVDLINKAIDAIVEKIKKE